VRGIEVDGEWKRGNGRRRGCMRSIHAPHCRWVKLGIGLKEDSHEAMKQIVRESKRVDGCGRCLLLYRIVLINIAAALDRLVYIIGVLEGSLYKTRCIIAGTLCDVQYMDVHSSTKANFIASVLAMHLCTLRVH
jgi:hypothetical protein